MHRGPSKPGPLSSIGISGPEMEPAAVRQVAKEEMFNAYMVIYCILDDLHAFFVQVGRSGHDKPFRHPASGRSGNGQCRHIRARCGGHH